MSRWPQTTRVLSTLQDDIKKEMVLLVFEGQWYWYLFRKGKLRTRQKLFGTEGIMKKFQQMTTKNMKMHSNILRK